MEWYYIVLLAILIFFIVVAIVVYLFREKIFNWAMATLLGVYIASPLDLLPDFIPVAGWSDDIAAFVFMIGFIYKGIKMLPKKKKNGKMQSAPTQVEQIPEEVYYNNKLINGVIMEDREIFYRRERLVPRERRLVPIKCSEKVFTDPFIFTCLVIVTIMILIVVVLHFT